MTVNANRSGIIAKLVWMFFMLTPTTISIFLAIQVRAILETQTGNEQLVCFATQQCAIEVNGIWYQISNVIDMSETIPPNYLPPTPQPQHITAQPNPEETQ
jgi:hypothetical protein